MNDSLLAELLLRAPLRVRISGRECARLALVEAARGQAGFVQVMSLEDMAEDAAQTWLEDTEALIEDFSWHNPYRDARATAGVIAGMVAGEQVHVPFRLCAFIAELHGYEALELLDTNIN